MAMGRRQAARQGTAWGSLGLAAAVLSSCFSLTQAQEIPIIVKPSQPVEGREISLTPGGKADFLRCVWYRGEEAEANRIFTYSPLSQDQQPGTSFTGRETGGPGCSLQIGSLMLNDTGNYVVSKIVCGGAAEMGHVEILVKGRHAGDKGVIAGITAEVLAGTLLIRILF